MKNEVEIIEEYNRIYLLYKNICSSTFQKKVYEQNAFKIKRLNNLLEILKMYKAQEITYYNNIINKIYEYLIFVSNVSKELKVTNKNDEREMKIRKGNIYFKRGKTPLPKQYLFDLSFNPKNEVEKELIRCIEIINSSDEMKSLKDASASKVVLKNSSFLNIVDLRDKDRGVCWDKNNNRIYLYATSYDSTESIFDFLKDVIGTNYNIIIKDLYNGIYQSKNDCSKLLKIKELVGENYVKYKLLNDL